MKLSNIKLRIDDLIHKYGDIDVEVNDHRIGYKIIGFAISKEYTYKTPEGITFVEHNCYDESNDEVFATLFKDDELIDTKYLICIDTIKEELNNEII